MAIKVPSFPTAGQKVLTGDVEVDPFSNEATIVGGTVVEVSKNDVSVGTQPEINFIEGSNVTLTVTEDTINQRIDVEIASSGGGSGGHTIRDDGSDMTGRDNLNFVSSTTIDAIATDDAGNNETEVTFQRAALSGAIAASANSNATLFSGIRDNGATENDRTNLNFVPGTFITVAVTDDAGNDELEIGYSLDLNALLAAISSTSIVIDSSTLHRAALSGAISAAQNSNATLFSGIRDNGVAETARTNINVLSTTSIIAAIAQDAGNDEQEWTWQRAALTGDVTASQNSNTTAFRSFAAKSVLVNATNASAVPSDLAGSGAFQYLGVNSANTTLEWRTLSVHGSTSVVYSSNTFERAALTGAIAASQNSNATVFSGIRVNGSATTDRTNINFISGSGVTVDASDDAGNDEIEITISSANPVPASARFTFSTTTTDSDPGPGVLRLNNATQNLSDRIRVDLLDVDGANVRPWIESFSPELVAPGSRTEARVKLVGSNPDNFIVFHVSGYFENSGYRNLFATPIDSSGATPFTDGEVIHMFASPIHINGVRKNSTGSVAERRRLNLIEGSSISITVSDDSVNDEVDITLAYAPDYPAIVAAIDSTSIVSNGSTIERAALTGAIAASQNSNATVFSGIRINGAATTDRTNINFISGSGMTVAASDDAGNDEIEITISATAASVTPTTVAVFGTPTNTGVPFIIYVSFTAGTPGTADDVTVFSSTAPFNFRILEAWLVTNTAITASTVQARTATGGAGSALSTAMSSTATGKTSDNSTATTTVASGGSMFLRRSDRGVAGEFFAMCVRT